MKHIFISHAGADAEFAKRLESDLRNAGHETKVDTRELKLGDDAINFMNDGIADAHTVIIVHSKHTPRANWQKLEINSAVWNEVAQSGGVCVVVRLDETATPDGRAVLLSFALSVRLCSKADQRSPKPFISKQAIEQREGRHFDPYRIIPALISELSECYGHRSVRNRARSCSQM